MGLVRLDFKGVSEIVSSEDVGLIILVDEDGQRQMFIICDAAMIYQFSMRMSKSQVVEKLLPEVLWQVILRNLELRFQVVINDLVDGQYKTLLYMPDILQAIPMRASDAILLANIAKLPIFVEENLFLRQSVPHQDNSVGVSVPVNVLSTDMLRRALDKAIADEDYEKASQLRDELNKRDGGAA